MRFVPDIGSRNFSNLLDALEAGLGGTSAFMRICGFIIMTMMLMESHTIQKMRIPAKSCGAVAANDTFVRHLDLAKHGRQD